MRYARLAAVAFLATVVVACGSSSNHLASKSPEDIQAAMVEAFKSAASVHLNGDFSEKGERLEMDLQITSTGDASGTVKSDGRTIYIIRADGEIYMNAAADDWEKFGGPVDGAAEAGALLADQWVKMPAGVPGLDVFEDATDLTKLANAMFSHGDFIKHPGTKIVNGKKVVALEEANGDIYYIAATGMPYPLRIEPKPGSGDTGYVDFFDYGQPLTITAPEGAVALTELVPGISIS
jgi:hypothetical protein